MPSDERRAALLEGYDAQAAYWRAILERVVAAEHLEVSLEDARAQYAALIDEMPYADRPDHALARFSDVTYPFLALYLAARELGHGAHEVGSAIHAVPVSRDERGDGARAMPHLSRDAEISQRDAPPEEFVFRLVRGDGVEFDYGLDVLSCAVCHAFAKHDASELVPYMCALDDKVAEGSSRALRRTGSIALGASHCDFRFKLGGEPLPLAPRYRDRIRIAPATPPDGARAKRDEG